MREAGPSFLGPNVREMRGRLGLGQLELARRLGISVSYLSQIESGARPVTTAVLLALARTFPREWSNVSPDEDGSLLASAAEAAADPTIPADPVPEDLLRRGARQQPLLARRLVAVHAAYRRAQDQLAALNDAVEDIIEEDAPLPWQEVRDWFQNAGNYIDSIDRAAEALHAQLAGDRTPFAAALEHRLRSYHNVRVDREARSGLEKSLSLFDAAGARVAIDPSLPAESANFLLAYQLARLEFSDMIQDIIEGTQARSDEARTLLSIGLANYAAGAVMMPYAAFRAEARLARHDIDQIRRRFGTSFEQACHRLSTLQRPGAEGVPFFFCRVDMAGNITKRHSATRLQFARFGGACPLWIVHEAAAIPDRILVQLAETPDGVRYVSMAKGLVKPTASYLRSPRRYAVALGCEIDHADSFVYADQLALKGASSATPIGTSCRVCPRNDCEQRAFPPAGRTIVVDPDRRSVVPYSFT
jgi:predicted transcriptional regulator/DNA-binding XRE family transcriptional regulator